MFCWGLFLYAVGSLSAEGIAQFLESPYGIVADVKMASTFFRHMGVAAAVVIGILVLASVFVQNFWCRFLCPYGALMGLAALASPLRIFRRGKRLHRLREMPPRHVRRNCRSIS